MTQAPLGDLHLARMVVAHEELDVLVYPDIGMDSLTYFMSFARLAPVQVRETLALAPSSRPPNRANSVEFRRKIVSVECVCTLKRRSQHAPTV